MEMDITGVKENEFVCDSNEALQFKLVRTIEDIEDDSLIFKPEMTHQIFGDNESIFGYKNLEVKMYYSACSLNIYIHQTYDRIIDPKKYGDIKPDNVFGMLQEKLCLTDVITNCDEFVTVIKSEDAFQPYGNKLTSFSINQDSVGNTKNTYEIYHCQVHDRKFMKFYERLQTFILFFIDAASYIETDDSKWQLFIVYEKFKNPNGKYCYAVAGLCTVYEYYAYPDRLRPRVSQMLVLPPFQRKGLGAQLLRTVYQYYQGQDSVLDITVEDPSEEFQLLRDYVDASLCSSLKSFSIDVIKQGYNSSMASEACSKFKINKKQARRIYEILRLKETNIHDMKDYSSYRLDVKRRLNIPFQKENNLIKKVKHLVDDDPQLLTALGLKTPEQRFKVLEQMFSDAEEKYQKVLERLENHPLVI